MTAAIYARKSTDQSGVTDEARSVTRQIERAKAYASRKGWQVDDALVYVDDGISGAEFANRPGFLRLMNALKPHAPFQMLVMSEESRLGREAIETAYALKQVIQANVRVFFYLEDRERTLESPTDKLLLSVKTFADELEREKARQRTYDAMHRKAQAGHVTGGRVFGYDNREVRVVGSDGRPRRSHVERQINVRERDVVRRVFALYASGYGFSRIAKTLNEEGACCPRAQQGRPNGWAPSSVREVLHRPLYRGLVVWNQTRKRDVWGRKRQTRKAPGDRIEVPAPSLRIVPDELWFTVQQRLSETATKALRLSGGRLMGRPPRTGAKYLLSGLLRCAQCGSTLEARSRAHGRQQERVLFYGCAGYHKRGRTVCTNNLTIPMDDFDFTVLAAVEDQILDPSIVDEALDRAVADLQTDRTADRRTQLERDLSRLNTEIRNLTTAVTSGADVISLVDALREREAQRAITEHDLRTLRESASEVLSAPAIRAELRGYLSEWRNLLRQHVAQAQQILRRLVVGRLDCQARPEGYYQVTGSGTIQRIIEACVPLLVASPSGFEPEFWP